MAVTNGSLLTAHTELQLLVEFNKPLQALRTLQLRERESDTDDMQLGITVHCSLLTVHCSLFTVHCSLLTALISPDATALEETIEIDC